MLIEPQMLKRLETLNWCEKCSTIANLDSFQVDGFVESVLGFSKTRKIFEAVKLGEDVRKARTIPVPAETFFRNILRLVDHNLLIFHSLRDRKPGCGSIKTIDQPETLEALCTQKIMIKAAIDWALALSYHLMLIAIFCINLWILYLFFTN